MRPLGFVFGFLLTLSFVPAARARVRCPKGYRWNKKQIRCKKIRPKISKKPKIPKVHIKMVKIKPGSFFTGAKGFESVFPFKHPRRKIVLSSPYYLGKFEVTRKIWTQVMKSTPFAHRKCKETCPATDVSWAQVIHFCNKLSSFHRLTPCYKGHGTAVTWDRSCTGYRLPTEAEWEYAARAGDTGDQPANVSLYAWSGANAPRNRFGRPMASPVGTRLPNKWGLHDMLGNAFEWVWDRFGRLPRKRRGVEVIMRDPAGPKVGIKRIFRGGCFWGSHRRILYYKRSFAKPTHKYFTIGFRLARSFKTKEKNPRSLSEYERWRKGSFNKPKPALVLVIPPQAGLHSYR